MTKEECKRVWDEIFAKHRALVRMKIPGHEHLSVIKVQERSCDCITSVLKDNGYDLFYTTVYGGIPPSSLSSDWKERLLNFVLDDGRQKFKSMGANPTVA